MKKAAQYDPNMFELRRVPLLHQAFAKAWRALTAQQPDPENEPGSIGLQCRIAATIIAVAAGGISDPARLAKAAIERCAPTPALRLG